MKDKNQSRECLKALVICSTLLNIGCAATGKINDIDPYESFNRPVHKFNSKVDTYVAKPLADAYKWITPTFLQTRVNNFFNNLQDVNIVLNDILQAKFRQGAQDAGRLTLNSTIGLGGFFDVASKAGLDKHNEDFGQTLAVWGLPPGAYLVLPFLGPSTLRELPGYIVDTAANPGSYLGFALPLAGNLLNTSVSMINSRVNAEGSLQFINEAALDPYVFMRESFIQWRNYQASDGKVSPDKAMDDLEADMLDGDKNSTTPQPKPSISTAATTANAPSANVPSKSKPLAKPLSYEEARRLFNEASSKLNALKPKQ